MNKKHACAAIIINEDMMILLVKRKRAPFKNSWTCPGGKGLKNESSIETVVRETWEETNLTFKPTTLFQYQQTEKRDYYKYLGDYSRDIEIRPNKELSEYGWFDYHQTKTLYLGFDFREVIKKLYSSNLIKRTLQN